MIRALFILVLLIAPQIARAGFLDTLECVSTNNTTDSGQVLAGGCTLTDISTGFIQLIQLMLGAIGAVALFYFAYGAFYWVTSMGFPNKVKRGQDIMLHTIFALIVTFTSYIILDFFVNKVLVVEQEYQIKSECSGQPQNRTCNREIGINYVCNGSGGCVTKCQLRAQETQQRWECLYIAHPELGVDANPQFFVRNLCPNDEHYICTRTDHPDWQTFIDVQSHFLY